MTTCINQECIFCKRLMSKNESHSGFCKDCDGFLKSDVYISDEHKAAFIDKTIEERVESKEPFNLEYKSSEWYISSKDVTIYHKYFIQADLNNDGVVDGHEANKFFTKSKLNRKLLAKIWILCDQENKSELTEPMFCAMFHIVMKIKKSANKLQVPSSLPECLTVSVVQQLMFGGEIKKRIIKVPNPNKKSSTYATATEYAMSGYIRQNIENVLDTKLIIPLSIIKICTQFARKYEWIDYSIYDECILQRTVHRNPLSILLECRENVDSNYSTFVSQIGFNKGIHIWMLQCMKYEIDDNDEIGIVSMADISNKNKWLNQKGFGHTLYYSNGSWMELDHGVFVNGSMKSENKGWKTGDILIIKLDFNSFSKPRFGITVLRDECIKAHMETELKVVIKKNEKLYPVIGFARNTSKYQLILNHV